MIQNIEIKKFRQFEDNNIHFGKVLTVISGHNASGKSTVLGLVGNSCQLLSKTKPYLQKNFQAEWSDIFKGSLTFDKTGTHNYKVNFSSHSNPKEISDYRDFRSTWQTTNKGSDIQDRFRLIPLKYYIDPVTNKKKKTESKISYPILYLGLSRLYPTGESSYSLEHSKIKISEEDKKCFVESYYSIFKNRDTINEINEIEMKEFSNKNTVGITTDKYDHITNSSGQSNISQILLSLLSFTKLKAATDEWKGGILLIDEIDATIHPAAQKNLINFLIDFGRKNNIQIIVTTHSLSILEEICRKTKNNQSDNINEIEHIYITKSNGPIDIKRNIDFHAVSADIKSICSITDPNRKKLFVYSEDSEARWLLDKLIHEHKFRMHFVNINVGCDTLISFNKEDISYFSKTLIVLDGDYKNKVDLDITSKNNFNILSLPGNCRPEQVIYEYLINLHPEHELLAQGFEYGFSKSRIIEEGPNSKEYSNIKDERARYKKWFNTIQPALEALNVVDYWIQDNPTEYNEFLNQFKIKFNILAERNMLQLIK